MLSLWPLEQFIFKFEYSKIRRLNLPVLPYLIGQSLLYLLVLTVTPGKLVFLHDSRFRLFVTTRMPLPHCSAMHYCRKLQRSGAVSIRDTSVKSASI